MFNFLSIMKFSVPENQMEDFQNMLMSGDKDILHDVMHWCLFRFDHLQKKSYLSKFLMPIDIPQEYMQDDLIVELSQRVKELQGEQIFIIRS